MRPAVASLEERREEVIEGQMENKEAVDNKYQEWKKDNGRREIATDIDAKGVIVEKRAH